MATTTKTRKAAPKKARTYRKAGSEAVKINWQEFIEQMLDPAIPARLGKTYSGFKSGSNGTGYSPMNQMWIFLQSKPGDVYPAGPYGTWKSKGRNPKTGTAKTVLKPVFAYKTETDATGKEKKVQIGPIDYKPIKSVFFYSDTYGDKELTLEPLDDDWTLDRALEELDIKQVDYKLLDGNTQGYSSGREFALNPVAAHPWKTTFHELAHIVLGHTSDEGVKEYASHRGIMEFQAEAVAYIVSHELELTDWDASESRAYVRGWLGGGEVSDKHIRQVFGAVSKILNAGRSKVEEEGEGEAA